ncbi:MAG: PspA/IM30 family protein [Candidatus Obscuribacterales bacterium]|nr:PspA/IM30 family protein [Candidatus Obscuribacterales bacterium]
MFDRLMNIFKAMFNAGVSKMETPEILAEQAQMELDSSVKKVQEALTASITNEKMLEQQLKKAEEEKQSWEKRAALAVGQNNDEVARQCILKKVELTKHQESLSAQLTDQKKASADLKRRYGELELQQKDFQRKKQAMQARSKGSDAIAKANELASGTGSSSMDKWEEKIRAKEIKNEAMQEMRGISTNMEQLKALDQLSEVDQELALLKAKVESKEEGKPKLIVQNPADDAIDAELVDDSVPMLLDDKEKK